jgi:hypothetical protein
VEAISLGSQIGRELSHSHIHFFPFNARSKSNLPHVEAVGRLAIQPQTDAANVCARAMRWAQPSNCATARHDSDSENPAAEDGVLHDSASALDTAARGTDSAGQEGKSPRVTYTVVRAGREW